MRLFILAVAIMLGSNFLNAQASEIQPSLDSYLKLKDALVKSDAQKASTYAADFKNNFQKIELSKLKSDEQKAFLASKEAVLKQSELITKTTDLEKQRKAFAELSSSFWSLVKKSEGLSKTVYYDYCSMKKAYWLSTESAIANPYYGSKMLTCGTVSEKKSK